MILKLTRSNEMNKIFIVLLMVFVGSKNLYANQQDSIIIQNNKFLFSYCDQSNGFKLSRIFFIYKQDTSLVNQNFDSKFIKIFNNKSLEILPFYSTKYLDNGFGMIFYLTEGIQMSNEIEILKMDGWEKITIQNLPSFYDTTKSTLLNKKLFSKLDSIICWNIQFDRGNMEYVSKNIKELSKEENVLKLQNYYPYWEFQYKKEMYHDKNKNMYNMDNSVDYFKKMMETGKNDTTFINEFFIIYYDKINIKYKDANNSTEYLKVIDEYEEFIKIFEKFKKINFESGIVIAKFNILLLYYFMNDQAKIISDSTYFLEKFKYYTVSQNYFESKLKYHSYLILGNICSLIGRKEEARNYYNLIITSAKAEIPDAIEYQNDAEYNLNLISK